MKVLIAYASAHGSTAEIAVFMERILSAYDLDVTVQSAGEVTSVDGYDAVIAGSAAQGGMWLHDMSQFLAHHQDALATRPFYFFLTCIRILEENGHDHVMKNYLHHDTLNNLHVREIGLFSGKLAIGTIDWEERWMLAVKYDGQEMASHVNMDYRNWNDIATFTVKVATALGAKPSF